LDIFWLVPNFPPESNSLAAPISFFVPMIFLVLSLPTLEP
jgi:hypothetical protein